MISRNVTVRNQLHCISFEISSMFNTTYLDVQPSKSGLKSYLLISLTNPLFKTPLGLQKHSIAIVRDRLQQFITTMVRFRVGYGGDGVVIRTMYVSTKADRR